MYTGVCRKWDCDVLNQKKLPLVGQIEKGTLIDRSCAEFLNGAHSRLSQDGVHREDGKTREPSEYLRFAVATWKQPRRKNSGSGKPDDTRGRGVVRGDSGESSMFTSSYIFHLCLLFYF